MSLLADLLSKTKQPQARREVPPNLVNIVQQASKRSTGRKKILLLSVVFFISAAAGLFTVRFVGTLEDSAKGGIVVAKTDMTGHMERAGVDRPSHPGEQENRDYSALMKEDKGPAEEAAAKTEGPTDRENLPAEEGMLSMGREKTDKPSEAVKKEPLIAENEASPALKEGSKEKEAPFPVRNDHVDKVDVYLYEAMEYEKKNDLLNALAAYKKILGIDSNNLSAMNNIAYIYLQLNLPEKSIAYSSMAVSIDNKYVPALINLGIAHGQLQDYAAAGDFLNRAAALSPDNQAVLLNLAILYEGQGAYDDAAGYYSSLERYGSVEGLLGLARINEQQEREEEALEYYQRVYALSSIDDRTRSRVRQRIAVLMNTPRWSRK